VEDANCTCGANEGHNLSSREQAKFSRLLDRADDEHLIGEMVKDLLAGSKNDNIVQRNRMISTRTCEVHKQIHLTIICHLTTKDKK
jgi:hypothetical protein